MRMSTKFGMPSIYHDGIYYDMNEAIKQEDGYVMAVKVRDDLRPSYYRDSLKVVEQDTFQELKNYFNKKQPLSSIAIL